MWGEEGLILLDILLHKVSFAKKKILLRSVLSYVLKILEYCHKLQSMLELLQKN